MSDKKPRRIVSSSITLTPAQHEEYLRVSEVFHKVFNSLLLQWYGWAQRKPFPNITSSDFKFINERHRSLVYHVTWIEEDCEQIALFAANELCRVLTENELKGLPVPHKETNPIIRPTNEVVFYQDYNIKVKEKFVRLPVLGKAPVGKFNYFSGSIRAIGVKVDSNGDMRCNIYYEENEVIFDESDHNVWKVGDQDIPQTPLNFRLRKAGIGFMT